jgi:metal-responsive CopG/Arc/MetJ family transcriptional regulator
MSKIGRPKEIEGKGINITVHLTESIVIWLDDYVELNGCKSRSEALRNLLEHFWLQSLQKK